MSRTITSPMGEALAAPQLAPVFFVELDFSSGFVRMWNGVGEISWDGKIWTGGGHLMALTQIEETRDVEATAMSMSLSGVDPALVSVAYGDFSQGRPAQIWLAVMTVSSAQIVNDPVSIFAGRMDTISDTDDGSSAVISVTAETNLTDLKRLRTRFYTDQDQQRVFPGDRSLRFLPSLQERPIYWGAREGIAPLAQVQ